MPDQRCDAEPADALLPEHDRLADFAGSWRAEVRHWPRPDAEPNVSHGVMTNTLVIGGRWLQQAYRCDSGRFEGAGFWGYDPVTRAWQGTWIDSSLSGMMVDTGTMDDAGRVWTMTGDVVNPTNGETIHKRSVITAQGRDRHVMEMFFETPAGAFRAMEIVYTRA